MTPELPGQALMIEASAPDAVAGKKSLRPAPASLRMQILSTEHGSLLATRSMTWEESFHRAQMFLTALSGAVVALALVSQATSFGSGFATFALVLLPVVLFLGLTTFIRLVAINHDEYRWVIGMNRIRAAYLELAPELEPYFVTGYHDDWKGVMRTAGWSDFPTLRGYVTTPAVVCVIDGVVAAVIVFLAADQVHASTPIAATLGVVAFVAWNVALSQYTTRGYRKSERAHRSLSPTPIGEGAPQPVE